MSNEFYVYLLLDPRSFYEPFYVGKGKGDRWKHHYQASATRKGKNQLKNAVIEKIRKEGHAPCSLIWSHGLNEKDAYDLEMELIMRFGRRVTGEGNLTNLSEGGRGGSSGMVVSEEFRQRCRQRVSGHGNPMYGRNHSDETKARWSEIRKGNCSYPHSEEHRQKLREDNPGGRATSKPVWQIGLDGTTVSKWPSASRAATELGILKSGIGNAIAGRTKSAGGFVWRFVDP